MKRKRRVKSIADNLVFQSRESALSAVQIFNNPTMLFKSESYIVLMVIAWTYLLHAHYRRKGIEYRYYRKKGKVRRFDKTRNGAHKYWSLTDCIDCNESPLDKNTSNNLKFLVGLRNEIEHQATFGLDDQLYDRYLACAFNFNLYINQLHGAKFNIGKYLAASIQFRNLIPDQLIQDSTANVPSSTQSYILDFDQSLSEEELNHPRFTQNVFFFRKLVNHLGQADEVYKFVGPEAESANQAEIQHWVLKPVERERFLPGEIVRKMKELGFPKFNMHHHTRLWQSLNAKSPSKGYGTFATRESKQWYWYENWLTVVKEHCDNNRAIYSA